MTLRAIVSALGGDLYQGGLRANVPAPGHSPADRSVSLLLSNGSVIIHGFGRADWRTVRDQLRNGGFIDAAGRLRGGGGAGSSAPKPDRRIRLETARRLWAGGVPLSGSDPASLHLRRRAVGGGEAAQNLRFHPDAPISVYRQGGRRLPALIAAVREPGGDLSAIELTYVAPNGLRASGLALSRKTVGVVPPGSAVRLRAVAPEMLVGEGIVTTLSAIDRFALPGWALMSANNLAVWTPPAGVHRVLVAADRGKAGEDAAARLAGRLARMGVAARVILPAPTFDDWNAAARGAPERKEAGR